MAQEVASESYEDFVSQILRPTNLPNLKAPVKYEKVSILIYRDASSDEPTEELELDNIYPFYTVAELSTFIYHIKETKSEFHPKNQCLMKESRSRQFTNLKYLFNKSTSTEFVSPFDLVASGKANPRFVDLEGNPQIQDITSRNQMLLEDVLFNRNYHKEDDVYKIHLFLYTDIYAAYAGIRPVNRVDWEGMFKVYFPEYDKSQEDGSLTQEEERYAPVRVQRFLERQKAVEKLDQMLIEEMPLRKPGETTRGDAINFSNVRNLRFKWDKPPKFIKGGGYQSFRLESVFYDTPVSEEMPYIRYYPVSNATSPISKIHVDGPLGIPTMEDPQILVKWSQERPLLPEQEFIAAKVLIRPGSGSVHPLYGTLNIFEDGSAMFSIQPNTDAKSLSKQADLYNLVPTLNSVMKSIPGLQPKLGMALPPIKIYSPTTVKLADAYIVLSLWLDKEDKDVITAKSLAKTLPFFRSFFQITTSPIKEQSPIAFLRYKCVNNFQTPSRDFQFLMRVLDLQKIHGQTSIPTLVKIYKEEFDVSDEVANRRVSSFVLNKDKYSIVNPETLEYTQAENPGIDIAIFGRHPFYTFHIYRVESHNTLQRIKTLLSLLISVSPDNFKEENVHSAEVLEEEQEREEEEAEASASASAQAEEAEEVADASASTEAEAEAGAEQELKSMAVKSVVEHEMGLEEEGPGDAADFDDGLGDFDGFGEEDTAGASNLEEALALHNSRLRKPLSAAPGAPIAAAPPPVPPRFSVPKAAKTPLQALVDSAEGAEEEDEAEEAKAAGDDDEITDEAQIKQQASKVYFRKRLQFYDKTLFSYSKTHPSLKKYPSMCAANALKQPTVMTEDEYERMKDIYSKEITQGSVLFIEYPLKKGTPMPKALNPGGKPTEIISVLRYGSNLLPGQANIFICSEYWCRYDEIVLLKEEFENKGLDRKGKPKDKNMCPFCRKGLVTNKSAVLEGESVISRSVKGKKHRFVNFLKKTPHPQGLYLPCCFISNHYIDTEHPAYLPLKSQAQKLVKGGPVAAAEKKPEEPQVKVKAVNYKTTLQSIFSDSMSDRPYIVGAEKLPLEFTKNGPQIGVIPKGADAYFTQNSLGTATIPGLVVQDHTVWKLMTDNTTKKTNATGLFRIAAENSKRNQPESFFSAVAPYFGENSAAGMKKRIIDLMTMSPTLFLSLNYGNLLFDFYDPTKTPNIEEDPDTKKKRTLYESTQIKDFAAKLKIDYVSGTPRDLIQRALKGYTRFMDILMNDPTYTKEYRQFAQLLSLPKLLGWEDFSEEKRIRHNGILFIVLEVAHDNTVEVRCPPYGVTSHHAECDIAFILHYASGIWEPLFHVKGHPSSDITMVFSRDTYASWPPIVKQRVEEFEKMCHSSGLGIYTDSPHIQANALLPLGKAMEINTEDGTQVHGIMRDIYNHVSFVIYNVEGALVLVPVIDDGSVHHTKKLEVEWRSLFLKLAKEDVVRKFYAEKVTPMLDPGNDVQLETYKTQRLMRLGKTDEMRNYVYALVIGNNLHVPVSGKSEAVAEELEEGSETMWSIDRKIAFGKLDADVVKTVDYKDFEEIYQHLRFSFSNWYALLPPSAREPPNKSLKQEIDEILFKDGFPNMDLPLFEKRQRLLIRLDPVIRAWLSPSAHTPDRNPSLKRIDCRVIVEKEGCKGRCVWKGGEDDAATPCLLHTPETVTVGSKGVSAVDLLIKKLIEELIRFPLKCKELTQQRVSQYIKLTSAFRSGSQYIVPEDLPAWSEILRMEWRKKQESRYYEEYAAIQPQEYKPEHVVPAFSTSSNPELKALVGDKYFFIEEPGGSLGASIGHILQKHGLSEDYLESIGQDMNTPIVDEETAKRISKKLQLSIYQIVYEPDNPVPPEPLIVKLQRHAKEKPAPFLIIVKLPDERVGTINMSMDALEPIPYADVPRPNIYGSILKKKEFVQAGL